MWTRRTRSKEVIALLSSLLQPLVDSGFLDATEVGRIAQTCKTFNEACLQDAIWASFCTREYPVTQFLANDIKESKGYRLLYKSWSVPVVKRRPRARLFLGPPSCVPKQVSVVVNIKYNHKPVYDKVIHLDRSGSSFLDKGSVGINVRSPIVLGKAQWNYTSDEMQMYQRGAITWRQGIRTDWAARGLRVNCPDFDLTKLDIRVHLFRSYDQAMCCLFSSQASVVRNGGPLVFMHPENTATNGITLQSKFDLARGYEPICISCQHAPNAETEGWPLQHTRQAELIMEAFPHPLFLRTNLKLSVVEGDKFAITKVGLVAMTIDSGGLRKFKNVPETEKHGVTMLHVLSELQGTSL